MSSLPSLDVFETDAGQEWLRENLEHSDLSLVEESLTLVVDSTDGYLDLVEGLRGLAALEVLLAALSRPNSSLLEQDALMKWVRQCRDRSAKELLPLAKKALIRIQADDSELNEHWEESDSPESWTDYTEEMAERLLR